MNRIVYERLRGITPSKKIVDMTIPELEKDCHIAFEIIGYNPQNLSDSVMEIYMNKDIEDLYEFIYEVWNYDS